MGQKRKRNHWVPQSYLRAFAADADRRAKIWRFSKDKGDPELKPIEKVAVRFHLYAPKDAAGKRDYSFEEKLSELETWFGSPVWAQLCDGMVDLQSQPVRKMIALLVAVMYLRSPAQLAVRKAMHQQLVDMISALPELPEAFEHKGKVHRFDPDSWPAYLNAGEEDIKRDWLKDVGSAADVAELVMAMRWTVLFSENPVFITADNPVTIVHPSLAFRGIKNAETSLVFPLSPTRVLHIDNRHSEPDGHYHPVDPGPAAINALLWRGAMEHVFSHRHPDLVCAEIVEATEKTREDKHA